MHSCIQRKISWREEERAREESEREDERTRAKNEHRTVSANMLSAEQVKEREREREREANFHAAMNPEMICRLNCQRKTG